MAFGALPETLFAGPALALAMLAATPASAACTDPAGPNVDWQRCYHDERVIVDKDLTGARLREAKFTNGDLSRSVLANADGRRAKFVGAALAGTVFDGANLTEADFTRANLTGASFKNADLRRARLFRAILKGADLSGARLERTDLLNADLSGATWTDGKTVCAEGSVSLCK